MILCRPHRKNREGQKQFLSLAPYSNQEIGFSVKGKTIFSVPPRIHDIFPMKLKPCLLIMQFDRTGMSMELSKWIYDPYISRL